MYGIERLFPKIFPDFDASHLLFNDRPPLLFLYLGDAPDFYKAQETVASYT